MKKIKLYFVLFSLVLLGNNTITMASCSLGEFNGNTSPCIAPGTYQNVWLQAAMFPNNGGNTCVGKFSGSLQRRVSGTSTWGTVIPNVQLFEDLTLNNQSSFNDVGIITQLAGTSYDYQFLFTFNPALPANPCGTLPNETCTTNIVTINVRANAVADFKINNTIVSATSALNVFGYGCSGQAFTFNSLAAGSPTSAQHKLYWKEANSSGTVIGATYGNTSWIPGFPASSIDLKTYAGGQLGTAAALNKYWLIYLEVSNTCVSSNIKTGLVKVNPAPTSATSAFQFCCNPGPLGASQSCTSPTIVGKYGGGVSGITSTGYITSYQVKIEEVTCPSTLTLVANSPTYPVPSGNPADIANKTLNGIVYDATGVSGYFATNSSTWTKRYKVTYKVSNQCGSSTSIGYFNPSGEWRLGDPTVNNAESSNRSFNVFPNPTNGHFRLEFNSSEKLLALKIIDLSGKVIKYYNSLTMEDTQVDLDVSDVASGIYFVEASTASTKYKSKILIQK